MAERAVNNPIGTGESLLFLTDEQLRRGIEAMFSLTGDLQLILIGFCKITNMAVPIIVPSTSSTAPQERQSIIC